MAKMFLFNFLLKIVKFSGDFQLCSPNENEMKVGFIIIWKYYFHLVCLLVFVREMAFFTEIRWEMMRWLEHFSVSRTTYDNFSIYFTEKELITPDDYCFLFASHSASHEYITNPCSIFHMVTRMENDAIFCMSYRTS